MVNIILCLFFIIYLLLVSSESKRLGVDNYIFNGTIARIEDFPHSVYLRSNNCTKYSHMKYKVWTGIILSRKVILTSPWVLTYCAAKEIRAYVGHPYWRNGTEIKVKKFYVHPQYLEYGKNKHRIPENDIALIILDETLKYSKTVKPIKMARKKCEDNKEHTIAGWGHFNSSSRYSPYLHYTEMITTACEPDLKKKICLIISPRGRYDLHGDEGAGLLNSKGELCAVSNDARYNDTDGRRVSVMADIIKYKLWIQVILVKLGQSEQSFNMREIWDEKDYEYYA